MVVYGIYVAFAGYCAIWEYFAILGCWTIVAPINAFTVINAKLTLGDSNTAKNIITKILQPNSTKYNTKKNTCSCEKEFLIGWGTTNGYPASVVGYGPDKANHEPPTIIGSNIVTNQYNILLHEKKQ